MRIRSAAIAALAAVLAACGPDGSGPPVEPLPAVPTVFSAEAREALAAPTRIDLLALHPYPHLEDGKPAGPEDDFHGYRVLGRATLDDATERRSLLSAVYAGIEDPSPPAACFSPRHGVRASGPAGSVDLVICFECDTVLVHSPAEATEHRFLPTSRAPEPSLDALLSKHGLRKHVADGK